MKRRVISIILGLFGCSLIVGGVIYLTVFWHPQKEHLTIEEAVAIQYKKLLTPDGKAQIEVQLFNTSDQTLKVHKKVVGEIYDANQQLLATLAHEVNETFTSNHVVSFSLESSRPYQEIDIIRWHYEDIAQ